MQTPPDSLIVDDAITAQVTSAAASIMGDQLSQVYLENVFLGFTTLGDQLGEAATARARSPTARSKAADGAAALPDGAPQLADGATRARVRREPARRGLGTIAGGIGGAAGGAHLGARPRRGRRRCERQTCRTGPRRPRDVRRDAAERQTAARRQCSATRADAGAWSRADAQAAEGGSPE